MRVVVDTNVLVSGALNPYGAPGRILDAILAETITLLYDDRILGEYREVLSRPAFRFLPSDVSALLDFIEQSGEAIVAAPSALVLADPTDLPFLEVAITGAATALITGNAKHFRPRKGSHNVDICPPAEFLTRLFRPR